MKIHGRFIWWIRINLYGHSWKTELQKKEVAFRFVRVMVFPDLDDKLEWPRFLASVSGC